MSRRSDDAVSPAILAYKVDLIGAPTSPEGWTVPYNNGESPERHNNCRNGHIYGHCRTAMGANSRRPVSSQWLTARKGFSKGRLFSSRTWGRWIFAHTLHSAMAPIASSVVSWQSITRGEPFTRGGAAVRKLSVDSTRQPSSNWSAGPHASVHVDRYEARMASRAL